MHVAMMTREYPPEVYGGAGVHVTELVAQLRRRCTVDLHCMGVERHGAFVYGPDPKLSDANPALSTLSADVAMTNGAGGATVAHSHTWYTGLAGHLAGLFYGIPHVVTAHSLEPMRPWKAEQLGGGYRVSSWVERTAMTAADAVIAVSSAMRDDMMGVYPELDPDRVHVVRNGVDPQTWYPAAARPERSVLSGLGVDPDRPIVAFVGRITRQKGVLHLLDAAHRFTPDAQLVLCAGAPDTAEIAAEFDAAVAALARHRAGVFWIPEMLSTEKVREVLSAAAVFVCPSVYEPLGIVNLEAMACSTAVVAADVGGIPEVVVDQVTGSLVHYDAADPAGYAAALADAVNALIADADTAERYGAAGRRRCIDEFSWAKIAEATLALYELVGA